MKLIEINEQKIGAGYAPFLVAEMSGNHNQSIERALEIVEAAAQTGVHAIKIQTYTADTMTIHANRDDFFVRDEGSLWKNQSLYELYQKAHTPWEWHDPIFHRANELGLIAFSTPFDHNAVDFLERLNAPLYKIASFEVVDLPLIKRIAQTGKPIIMSTGMATVAEIDEAVRTIRAVGNEQITLLKCTSTYPASPENSNLHTIPHLKKLFGCEVGLSDHTLGIGVAVAAVALGATVIEKHFTLNRADGGVDAAFSMEPHEMKMLVEETHRAWQALGKVHYGPTEAEKKSLVYRRSLYFVKDMEVGEVITPEAIRSIRPGYGLPPKYYDVLLGKRVRCAVEKGDPVRWDMI
ncbi:pseudaminic acid synthase [Gloeomargarita lithophora Alchichica-D10]|uniref:Pseudaminic acid synthase n=1 Tax=Gloeomargarita lithophora Alchichica-D10 TaxID=1188229 RepID=A0A1J0ADH1_9CYAN|nr:pseudaminic acid synthase [Gloeomargarita lithophora]APB33959.1 pseudaminic acid synthase [Gloeomargarita lithophora Alchichica-D10]